MWGPQTGAVLTVAIVLAIAAVVGTLVAWSRVRGPAPVRVLQRVGLVVLCQVTAVAVAGVAINRLDSFFVTWTDVGGLLQDVGGTIPSASAHPSAPPVRQVAVDGVTQASFTWSGGLWRSHIHGEASGVTGDVTVWTPSGYDAHRAGGYRVLLALSGYPGTPVSVIKGLGLHDGLTNAAAEGRMPPTLIVAATTNINGQNWDCADTPGGPRVATWLTHDVMGVVRSSFNVAPARWTTIGVSTGAYCAVRLAVTDPAQVGAAIAIAGDDAADSPALAGRANDLRTLVAAGAKPGVSLFVAASKQDGTTANDARALATNAGPGVTTTLHILDTGGHSWPAWAAMAAPGLDWLGAHEPS
jgi:S-formylglutathione hydrolase FrmB